MYLYSELYTWYPFNHFYKEGIIIPMLQMRESKLRKIK